MHWTKLTYFLNGSTSGSVHTLCCYRSNSVMCVICWCRPSFKSLKRISIQFPNIPVMALTATAPPILASQLEGILQDPEVFKGSVNHSNLIFAARKSKFGGKIPKAVSDGTTSAGDKFLRVTYWKPLVEELSPEIGDQPSIICVDCKKMAIDLTTSFNQHSNIKTAANTGEATSKSDKKAVISNWSDEEVTLIIATSAFGLGINKGNVCSIYHIGVPNSLETWMHAASS